MKYHESYDPAYWDLDRMAEYLATYPDIIQGLKIRISKPIIKENGFEIFKQAAATARQLGTRLCVHDQTAGRYGTSGLSPGCR